MEESRVFHVDFEGLTPAEANLAALELQSIIEARVPLETDVEIVKANPGTQDFGATLVIVLGTPVARMLAIAIRDYVAKRGSRVVIKTPAGEVVATGDAATNIDIQRTVEAMRVAQADG